MGEYESNLVALKANSPELIIQKLTRRRIGSCLNQKEVAEFLGVQVTVLTSLRQRKVISPRIIPSVSGKKTVYEFASHDIARAAIALALIATHTGYRNWKVDDESLESLLGHLETIQSFDDPEFLFYFLYQLSKKYAQSPSYFTLFTKKFWDDYMNQHNRQWLSLVEKHVQEQHRYLFSFPVQPLDA